MYFKKQNDKDKDNNNKNNKDKIEYKQHIISYIRMIFIQLLN